MALPILQNWNTYFEEYHEGLGSSYERIILNQLLSELKVKYKLENILEAPVFGFTGITGLNSFSLYQSGCKVTLLDHNEERINDIRRIHGLLKADISTQFVESYSELPFSDNSFDLGWNFSALWFVEDLTTFLNELTRVSKKAILICVPNQSGLGYKWQKAHADIPSRIIFNKEFINPGLIKSELLNLNWVCIKEDYIDCPLWPDIGMSKEKFLGKYLRKFNVNIEKKQSKQQISIMDYYSGKDPDFPQRMLKYSFLEKYASEFFKKIWSHHRWMLFEPSFLK